MNELSCKELLLRIGELEEELDKSRAEANRLRAESGKRTGGDGATDVRALARTLSHDLRTPLSPSPGSAISSAAGLPEIPIRKSTNTSTGFRKGWTGRKR